MSNNHTPPSQQRSDGVLAVSRLVWDHVVSPGWLDGPRDSLGNIKCGPDGLRQWDLFRAAEAMFPIVGLVCRRVLAYDPRFGAYIGSYFAIATAASVPAPSCVAWILNNRHVRGRVDNDIRDPVFVVVAKPGSPPLGRARPQGDERGCGCGGGVEVGVVVKEVSATLAGLLMGGHVGLAAALFGGGVGHSEPRKSRGSTTAATATATTCNTTSCTLPRLWDGRRVVSWEMACHTNVNDPDRRRKMGGRGKGIGRGAGRGRRGGKGRSDNLRRGGVAGLREKVIEYARAECGNLQLVRGVCHAGRADGVRWLVDVLGIEGKEAQWLMYESMQSCVSDGKMEVVKWLCGRFGFRSYWDKTVCLDLFEWCAWGNSPSNLKWCLDNFPAVPSENYMTRSLVSNKHSTVQDCQWRPWVEDDIREDGYSDILEDAHNPEVVKWLVTTLPSQPSEEEFNRVCKNTGDAELAQWLVTEHNFTPTAATFASACSTSRKKGATLARWLSLRVSLSQSDIIKSLVSALSSSNIEVAEWLDETFHVMDVVNSNTEVAENCLVEVCAERSDYKDRVVGLEWFLQHLSAPDHSGISMSCIHKAISQALYCRVNSVALLLETFPAVEPLLDQAQFEKLVSELLKCHIKGFQHLCSGARSAVLTPEFIGHCLTSESFHPYSSKEVKWVIQKFNLQYSQIKANHNCLFFNLLSGRKNRCVQWLLNRFDIPLSDIVDMAQLGSLREDSIDLTGWHMIVDHYGPAIDGALIRKHLMPLVSRSPHVAIHTIKSFGLTIDEFRDHVVAQSRNPFEASVKLWLGMPLS